MRLFYLLEWFPFTTLGTELDDYHEELTVRVASQVAEPLKTKISGNQEIS